MKKRNLLFLGLLFPLTTLQAQTEYVLHSFEDDFENEYSEVTWESRPHEEDAFETDLTITENPDKTGINQSDKVLWAQTHQPPTEPDGKTMPSWYRNVCLLKFDPGYPAIDSSCRYLHIMHYRTNPLAGWRLVINGENLLENANPPANEWVDIVVDLDRLPANKKEAGVYEIEFLMNVDWGGSAYPQTAFYVDNVILSSSPAPRADNHVYFENNDILNFEDEEVTNAQTAWGNNGGGDASVSTDNLENKGLNFSSKCAYSPGNGDGWWNGFRFDFKKLIPITNENKYLHVMMKWDDTEPRSALDVTYQNGGSGDQYVIYESDDNGLRLTNEWKDYIFEINPGANISVMEFKCKGAKVYMDEILLSDNPLPRTITATNNAGFTMTGPWSDYSIGQVLERDSITSIDLTQASVNAFTLPGQSNCLIYANTEIADRNCIVSGVTNNLILKDGAPFNCPTAFEAKQVTYQRNFLTNGGYETICIPFGIETKVWSELYTLASTKNDESESDKIVTFIESDKIVANVPYMVKWTSATGNTLTSTNVQIPVTDNLVASTEESSLHFNGTFTSVNNQNKYLIQADGKVTKGDSESNTSPFRAYLSDPKNLFQGNISLVLVDDPTGMNKTSTNTLQISTSGNSILINCGDEELISIHTIDGCLIYSAKVHAGTTTINNLPKGFYMVNNQKVIVK